jgi:hypothetical protein
MASTTHGVVGSHSGEGTLRETGRMEAPPHPRPSPRKRGEGALPLVGLESVKKNQQVAGT